MVISVENQAKSLSWSGQLVLGREKANELKDSMPFLVKCHAVGVFQCYLPEQSKQSIETLVELRPRNSAFMDACLICVYTCVCVYMFVSHMCLIQHVCVFVCVSVCL